MSNVSHKTKKKSKYDITLFFVVSGGRLTVYRRVQWTQIQVVLVQRGLRAAGHAGGRVPIFGHQEAHRDGGRRFQHHVLLLRTDRKRQNPHADRSAGNGERMVRSFGTVRLG